MTFPQPFWNFLTTVIQLIDDLPTIVGSFQQALNNLSCIFRQLLHDHPPTFPDIYDLLVFLYENVNYMKHLKINILISSSSPVGKSLIHWSSSASSGDTDNRDSDGTALIEFEAQFCK